MVVIICNLADLRWFLLLRFTSITMYTKTLLPFTFAASVALTGAASAVNLFGLTNDNRISIVDSAAPTVGIGGGFVRGLLDNGERLIDIDYRPANGQLYAVSSFDRLYTIDRSTFDLSLVGSGFSERLVGSSFGFDFNPAFMDGAFARIVSDTDNNRVVGGDTGDYLGTVEKTALFYAAGDTNEGADPNIGAIAYTNSVAGATTTQQFGIDLTIGSLVTVANNAGTLETVGSLGITGPALTTDASLDISGETGEAFAVLRNGPTSQLYTIDLATGAATAVGQFGPGEEIVSVAAVPVPEPSSVLLLGLGSLAVLRRRK